MYDLPALASATDALWAAIARALEARGVTGVPPALSRDLSFEDLWTHPDLLLGQACGLPLVILLAGRVRFVATPIYDVAGCTREGDYRSWLVVEAAAGYASVADLEGSVAAVNAPHSHSGANALAALTAPFANGQRFFADVVLTGAHAASLVAIRSGRAACAAVDCVTWHHLATTEPAAVAGLRILAASPPMPALPFITAATASDAATAQLREAIGAATRDPAAASACRRLALAGIAANDASAYARIRAMHAESLEAGCARLASLLADLAPKA